MYLDCVNILGPESGWKAIDSGQDVNERELSLLEKEIQQIFWGEVKGWYVFQQYHT